MIFRQRHNIIKISIQRRKVNEKQISVSFYMAFLSVLNLLFIFAFFGYMIIPETAESVLTNVAIIISTLLLIIVCVTAIISPYYISKKSKNVVKIQQELLSRSEKVRENYNRAEKKVDRIRIVAIIYAVVFAILLSFIAFTTLRSNAIPMHIVIYLLGAWSLFSSFDLTKASYNSIGCASPKDYPKLYEITKNVADKFGISEKIKIVFTPCDGLGISKKGKFIFLYVDVIFMSYTREEEFRSILYHEFAHIKGETKTVRRLRGFSEKIEPALTHPGLCLVMIFPVFMYKYEYELLDLFSTVIFEEEADKVMAKHGDKQAIANTLFKLHAYNIFSTNLDIYMDHCFYEPEECVHSLYQLISNKFLEKMKDEEFFKHLMNVELQPRSATHPLTSSRIKALGIDDVHLVAPETLGKYRAEAQKAIEKADADWYETASENYTEERKIYYLQPLETIKQWEEDNRKYTVESARRIVEALDYLNRTDDIIELCNKIIANEKGGLVDFAYFTRGRLLLTKFDNSGIDDLYLAIENNTDYTEVGMQLIGDYCCRVGLEKELNEYRKKSAKLLQKSLDMEGLNSLSFDDRLRRVTNEMLPQELFERNLSYFLSIGEPILKRIFLANKRLKKNLNRNIYVFEFISGTSAEEISKFMQSAFEFLDNAPEDIHYSVFVYDKRYSAPAVNKVTKSCIYKKRK